MLYKDEVHRYLMVDKLDQNSFSMYGGRKSTEAFNEIRVPSSSGLFGAFCSWRFTAPNIPRTVGRRTKNVNKDYTTIWEAPTGCKITKRPD
jgi:hypothetical protein